MHFWISNTCRKYGHMQDPRANWICNPTHAHREMRGLTAAGRKYRGLEGKGHLHTKCRPSRRATWKLNNQKSLRRYRSVFAQTLMFYASVPIRSVNLS